MTTAYVRTSENKWEQVRTSDQSVGHCGEKLNVNQQILHKSTLETTTSKQEKNKSTTILERNNHANWTQLGFYFRSRLLKILFDSQLNYFSYSKTS